jgi:hypothetical protein
MEASAVRTFSDDPSDSVASPGRGEPGDAIRTRECLIGQIVAQIRRQGFFLAHLDPMPFQYLIDLRWAAQAAGRTMERQVRTFASAVGARLPGKITVVIAPTDFVCPDEAARKAAVLLLVEDILAVRGNVAAKRSVA